MILGFDTATADTTVAVVGGSTLRESRRGPDSDGRPTHGRTLLSLIEAAVRDSGGWDSITAIAVGTGPGSFTGIRIGVSTGRALAQARGLPVIGVPSTSTLTLGLAELPGPADRARIGVIDARRGEVFAAVDRGLGVGEPVVCPPELLVEALAGELRGPIAGGDGALRFRSEIEAIGVEVPGESDPAHRLSARHMCELAAKMVETAEPGMESVVGLTPNYIRRPDAERWHERNDGN